MRVRFAACIRLVVEDVDVSVANLQEVDVSGDNVSLEIQVEPSHAVGAHVLACKEYRYLHRYRYGIVDP